MGLKVLGQLIEPGSMWYGFTYPDSVHLETEDIDTGYGANHYEGSFVSVGTPFSILNYFMSKYEGNLNNFVHSYDGQVYGEAWDSNGQPMTFIPGQYPNPTYHFCIGYWYDATNNSVHFFGGFQRYGNNAVVSRMHSDLGYHGMSLTSGPNDTDRAMASLYFFKPQEEYQPDLTLGHSGDTTYYGLGEGYRCAVNGVYSVQKRRWELFNNNVTGFSADTPLMGPATLMTTYYYGGQWYGPRPSGAPMPAPDYYGWFYGFTRDDYPGYNGPYYDVTNMGSIIEETEDEEEPEPYDDIVTPPDVGGGGDNGYHTDDPHEHTKPTVGALDSGMVHAYAPESQDLYDFASWLWSDDFIDNIDKLMGADPINAVVSLMRFPFSLASWKSDYKTSVVVGNVKNLNVEMYILTEDMIEINGGEVEITEQYGDFRDYSPLTKLRMYIPFVGFVDLDPNEVFSPIKWKKPTKLKLYYFVNLFTGEGVARVYMTQRAQPNSTRTGSNKYFEGEILIGQFSCQMGFSIPVTGADYRNYYKNKMSGFVSVVAGIGSMSSGNLGAVKEVWGGIEDMFFTGHSFTKAGSTTSGTALLNEYIPFIEIMSPIQTMDVSGYRRLAGDATSKYRQVSTVSGFNQFETIEITNFSGTDEEANELRELCHNGIII